MSLINDLVEIAHSGVKRSRDGSREYLIPGHLQTMSIILLVAVFFAIVVMAVVGLRVPMIGLALEVINGSAAIILTIVRMKIKHEAEYEIGRWIERHQIFHLLLLGASSYYLWVSLEMPIF